MWHFTLCLIFTITFLAFCQSFPVSMSDERETSWEPENILYNSVMEERIGKRGIPVPDPERNTDMSEKEPPIAYDDYVQRSIALPQDDWPLKTTKKNMFMSRGWGAGGMPFSVLYMAHHKPVSARPEAQAFTAHKEPLLQLVPVQNGGGGGDDVSGGSGGGGSGTTHALPSRRHYSIIPQLFVSYGWGPLGK